MIIFHDLTLFFNAIIFGVSLFLCIVLWVQKTKYRRSNRLLSLLLFAFAVATFNTIIRLTDYMYELEFYQDISNTFLLIIGPSVYLFILMRTSEARFLKQLYHFIPTVVYASILLIHFVFDLSQTKDLIDNLAFLTFIVQFFLYIYLSFGMLKKYENKTKENFSNIVKHDIGWIRVVLATMLIIWTVRLGLLFYSNMVAEVPDLLGLNITLLLSIAVCTIGFKIFVKPEIFIRLPSYESSNLSLSDLSRHIDKLDTVMVKDQLFLNPKLSISDVAVATNLHSRQVSQALNQGLRLNFFDYVNSHRVKYFQKKLEMPESISYKLQALMLDSGFQSPSVAYAAFKKATGLTPTQYRKLL